MLINIEVFKKIGERCDHYLTAHGVEATWSVHPHGFQFKAQYGADKVERLIHWSDIKDLEKDLRTLEYAALRGLSS